MNPRMWELLGSNPPADKNKQRILGGDTGVAQRGTDFKKKRKNVKGSHLGGFIFVNFETGCQNWSVLIASANLSVCPSVYPPPTDKLSVSLKYTTGNDFLLTESSCASLCRNPATELHAPACSNALYPVWC